jgi:hypothetical protein
MENENTLNPEINNDDAVTPIQEAPAPDLPAEEMTPSDEIPADEICSPEDTPEAEVAETTEPEAPKGIRKLIRKWWFWAIIAALAVLLVVGVTQSNSDSSSSSYSPPVVYEHPYVTLVKTTENSKYGVTYGAAFNSFFGSPRWEYFSASTGEDVVEFTGTFYYDNAPATATIQFVLDMDEGMLEVYHLSINGVGQSRLMLNTLIQKVFESY